MPIIHGVYELDTSVAGICHFGRSKRPKIILDRVFDRAI